MSPKSLLILLVVGLCATQMVSAHRETRSVSRFFNAAKGKLLSMVENVHDAATSSVKTVYKYMERLEGSVLEEGSKVLIENGIEVNLTDVANLLKTNIHLCAKDDEVKEKAQKIIGDVTSCVTGDISTIMSLVDDMRDIWQTAKNLPYTMTDASKECFPGDSVVDIDDKSAPASAGVSADVKATVKVDLEDDVEIDDDLADEAKALLAANHPRHRRALDRVIKCTQSLFRIAKGDLEMLPGQILSTATNAFKVVKSAQTGLAACVGGKLATNSGNIIGLARQVGSCVRDGVSEGEDLEDVLKKNPSLAKLAGFASNLGGAAGLMDKAGKLVKLANMVSG